MGQEIPSLDFSEQDFLNFQQKLYQETQLLKNKFNNHEFEDQKKCGIELEFWLIDKNLMPSASNQEFLNQIHDPHIIAELAQYNFEIATEPFNIESHLLTTIKQNLHHYWQKCQKKANKIQLDTLTIGILPVLTKKMFTVNKISPLNRYLAMEYQFKKMRKGQQILFDVPEADSLHFQHPCVVLESATTSLQIHLQIPPQKAVQYYNITQLISAPILSISANSPYLFGRQLWDETRITLFEQVVTTMSDQGRSRAAFGDDFIKNSIFEIFAENLKHYPVLLPAIAESEPDNLYHLRLHNGTIWRWNRPIIGITTENPIQHHLRIEHRVMPAGPSLVDMVANIAFFLGLVHYYSLQEQPIAQLISFQKVKENFYNAAKFSLNSKLYWLDGQEHEVSNLLINELLPAAKIGLQHYGICSKDINYYLEDILAARIKKKINGAIWQKAFIAKHGEDFKNMLAAYFLNQKNELPIHQWQV